MDLHPASVIDILRCTQKDNFLLEKLESSIFEILKIFGVEYCHQNTVEKLSSALYFVLTSCSDLQTFGEEYTGTIRFNTRTKKLPSKLTNLLWIVFHVTGDNVLHVFKQFITKSNLLTEGTKSLLLHCLCYLDTNKWLISRLKTALFYIRCDYYYIANLLFGIRYLLLRQWFQDDNYSRYFKFVGWVLLVHLYFYLIHQIRIPKTSQEYTHQYLKESKTIQKGNCCLICSEDTKSVVTTFCGHLFCWDCIESSLLYQEVCPICRELVSPNKIILLQNYS